MLYKDTFGGILLSESVSEAVHVRLEIQDLYLIRILTYNKDRSGVFVIILFFILKKTTHALGMNIQCRWGLYKHT